jgi:hypothetical protein
MTANRTFGLLHPNPTLRVLLRGQPVEISFAAAPNGNVPWWSQTPIDPPLEHDERRAIGAFVQQELSRRQEWWRGAQSRRQKKPQSGAPR